MLNKFHSKRKVNKETSNRKAKKKKFRKRLEKSGGKVAKEKVSSFKDINSIAS